MQRWRNVRDGNTGIATNGLRPRAAAVKNADKVILATDPDREGEAISWHVLELLNRRGVVKGKPVERVVFNGPSRVIDVSVSGAFAVSPEVDHDRGDVRPQEARDPGPPARITGVV